VREPARRLITYNTNGVSTDWGTPGKANSTCPSD
jgi:hypothetical protein